MRKYLSWIAVVILALLFLAGCASSQPDEFRPGQEFSLAVGQKAAIAGEDITIKFIDVTADSRCPRDVQCIWAGEVTCLIEVTSGTLNPYSLNLTQPGSNDQTKQAFDGHEITFRVEPYPAAGKPIARNEYRLVMTVTVKALSVPDLKYRLISSFSNVFWCDPDFYPVARPGQEEKNALEQFPTIKADEAEFPAILQHLGLADKTGFTDAEKLLIYRAHKELTYAVQMTAAGNTYNFTLRVGQGQGESIQGTIAPSGAIKVVKREPSFNTCPICLTAGMLIDTPSGAIPVELLRPGMAVWTIDSGGKAAASLVIEITSTPVPASFLVTRLTLGDGRSVTASPGHPTADGRALGDYLEGDTLDGAGVVAVEHLIYDEGTTYDFLPSGGTGIYLANGIALKSTLAIK